MFNQYSNFIPQQQILQANGKASIDAIRLAPNSSVLVMDTTAPIIWLCTSDSLGNVTSTPYDVQAHVDPTEAARKGMEERVTSLEENVKKILEVLNESHDGGTQPKQNDRNHESDSAS